MYEFFQHVRDWLHQDEVFVSAKDAGKHFEIQRTQSSSLLPEASVFDTLTDSILSGEMDVALLTDKNVNKQIRRGKRAKLHTFFFILFFLIHRN